MKKVTTLLFVYDYAFDPEKGGIERVTDIVSAALIERGYKVVYLIADRGGFIHPSIKTYNFPDGKKSTPRNHVFLQQILRDEAVDLLINQAGGMPISKLYTDKGDQAVKVVSFIHNNPLRFYNHFAQEAFLLRDQTPKEYLRTATQIICYPLIKYLFKKKIQWIYRILNRQSDLISLLSPLYIADVKQIYAPLCKKCIAIANPNTYDNTKIDIESPLHKEKIILYVGRLNMRSKNPKKLLKIWEKAADLLPDWQLIIVGDGEARLQLEQMAKKNSRIIFTGFCDPTPYYQKGAIICNVSYSEGFPMTLVEAMQWGTIPISFDSYAVANELITNNKNGIVVSSFDLDAYAQAMVSLANNPDLMTKMGRQAQIDIRKYDKEKIIDQWEEMIKSVIP